MPIAPTVYSDPGLLTESEEIFLLKYCGMAIVEQRRGLWDLLMVTGSFYRFYFTLAKD